MKKKTKQYTRYRISSNIPIPAGAERVEVRPFAKLKKGQSFGFPAAEAKAIRHASWSWRQKGQHKKKILFTIRVKGKKGRIWRIA